MSVENRTQRTSLLRGPVEDIPGLTTYLATNFLPIAGGTMAGDLDMDGNDLLSAGTISADNVDSANVYASTAMEIDGQPVATQAFASNASNLTSGTVPDARLSANVPLKNAASNAFTGPVTSGGSFTAANGNNGFAGGGIAIGFSGVSSGLIAGGQLNAYESGVSKESIVASQGFNLASDRGIYFSSTTASSGSKDVSLVRNATGPTLETRAAGGLKVCNADGSAVAAVQCSTVTASGTGSFGGTVTVGGSTTANLECRNSSNSLYAQFNGTNRSVALGGDAFAVLTQDGTSRIYDVGVFGWNTSNVASSGTLSGTISRASANTLQIGSNGRNASGSLLLTDLTASGLAKFTGYPTGLLPAAASNAGSITYDTTLAKHVGCDGTNWNALW